MIKLIKLELRRNNLKPYIWSSLGIFIFVLSMGVLFSALPTIDPTDSSAEMMSDFTMVSSLVSTIAMSGFAILSTVMHTKFIIEEYTGKKNVLLFTYPQKRSQILIAKFILVFVFTFLNLAISIIVALLLVGSIGNITGLITQPVSMENIIDILSFSLLFGIIANLISLIALRVGFMKKSLTWALITSIILTFPFSQSVMSLNNYLIPVFSVVSVVLLTICAILFLGLLKKVNKMECL